MIERDILFAPLGELRNLLRRRKLSPVRLTEAYLERIHEIDPKLRAFVTVMTERALREAGQAEKEIRAGLDRGPLHGIPYAAKDLFAAEGAPTTWGARPYAGQVFDRDAVAIRKLHDSGAILIGKSAMTELAGGPPAASATGACRTPWDTNRWSGGSSAGSGAAVAAGLIPFALGTETWGSIMTPASFCGVSGLRPTFGRISRSGAMALSWTMDKVGILARTAQDCASVFAVLQGRDDEDDATVAAGFKPSWTRAAEAFRSLRIGVIREDYARWGEPGVASAFAEALEICRGLGPRPEDVTIPDHPYETVAGTIIAAEEAAAFEPLVARGDVKGIIDPARRGELLGGQTITAVDYLRCQRLRRLMMKDFGTLFERYDVLLGSSTLQCAPPVDADLSTVFAGGNTIEAAENLLGLPGISIPCGFNGRNLPIGLKIIGPPMEEARILEVAHLFQSMTNWHRQRPKI
jgi:aspartyl-tRNA(Asn)/glutamyl-tRNA(Gln) amidotransferase subunit A